MDLRVGSPMASAVAISLMVSATYLGLTWLMFRAVQPFPAPRFVRFVARNTLVIFLAHMPVYYAVGSWLTRLEVSRGLRSAILGIICVPGLALVSEALHRTIHPRELRDRIYARLTHRAGAPAPLGILSIPRTDVLAQTGLVVAKIFNRTRHRGAR